MCTGIGKISSGIIVVHAEICFHGITLCQVSASNKKSCGDFGVFQSDSNDFLWRLWYLKLIQMKV